MDDQPGRGPSIIELDTGHEHDDLLVGRDELTRRLRLADAEALVGRDPFALRLLDRADEGLDHWQVLALRWRCRVGWPVTVDRSRVARLSDLSATEAVAALSAGSIRLRNAELDWGPPGPGRRVARELVEASGSCALRWAWPRLPIAVSVGEWSGRRCQLAVRIRPSLRLRWPRRWYETAHLFLIELDRELAAVADGHRAVLLDDVSGGAR
ncbi:MAG: hypothetical protein AAGD18_06465 [Actinomycetota bacterium]